MIPELQKLQAAADQYSYNPETGVFTFKNSPYKAKIGKVAGTWLERKCKGHTNFYLRLSVQINGKYTQVQAHRLAWFITYREIPDTIDHIEHIRRKDHSLNRLENLRNGTVRDNSSNRTDGTSKHTGVSLNKRDGTWKSQIQIDGKHEYIGTFKTEKEASEAYQKRKPSSKKY